MVQMLHVSTALNSVMNAAVPPVLHAAPLLDQLRGLICCTHYSLRTERAYVQ